MQYVQSALIPIGSVFLLTAGLYAPERASAAVINHVNVSAAEFFVEADQHFKESIGTETITNSGGSATATIQYNSGNVIGYLSGSSNLGSSSTTQASAFIFFYVDGPAGYTVPILLSAASTGAYAPTAFGTDAMADTTVVSPEFVTLEACALSIIPGVCTNEGKVVPHSFDTSVEAFVPSDFQSQYDVYLQAGSGDGGSYSVGIDPTIRIDPTFPEANEFSIIFSPNVAGSAIPEPAAWTMMLLGFAGLGFAGWRASRKSVAVTV